MSSTKDLRGERLTTPKFDAGTLLIPRGCRSAPDPRSHQHIRRFPGQDLIARACNPRTGLFNIHQHACITNWIVVPATAFFPDKIMGQRTCDGTRQARRGTLRITSITRTMSVHSGHRSSSALCSSRAGISNFRDWRPWTVTARRKTRLTMTSARCTTTMALARCRTSGGRSRNSPTCASATHTAATGKSFVPAGAGAMMWRATPWRRRNLPTAVNAGVAHDAERCRSGGHLVPALRSRLALVHSWH